MVNGSVRGKAAGRTLITLLRGSRLSSPDHTHLFLVFPAQHHCERGVRSKSSRVPRRGEKGTGSGRRGGEGRAPLLVLEATAFPPRPRLAKAKDQQEINLCGRRMVVRFIQDRDGSGSSVGSQGCWRVEGSR